MPRGPGGDFRKIMKLFTNKVFGMFRVFWRDAKILPFLTTFLNIDLKQLMVEINRGLEKTCRVVMYIFHRFFSPNGMENSQNHQEKCSCKVCNRHESHFQCQFIRVNVEKCAKKIKDGASILWRKQVHFLKFLINLQFADIFHFLKHLSFEKRKTDMFSSSKTSGFVEKLAGSTVLKKIAWWPEI